MVLKLPSIVLVTGNDLLLLSNVIVMYSKVYIVFNFALIYFLKQRITFFFFQFPSHYKRSHTPCLNVIVFSYTPSRPVLYILGRFPLVLLCLGFVLFSLCFQECCLCFSTRVLVGSHAM